MWWMMGFIQSDRDLKDASDEERDDAEMLWFPELRVLLQSVVLGL